MTNEAEAAIRALQGASENAEEALWRAVMACQEMPFRTATGLPFTYCLKIGQNGQPNRELLIDRREKSKTLSWSSVCLAFRRAREVGYADRPKALGDIRGVSYVYPLLWRFGVLRVPEIVEKNMSLTLEFGFFRDLKEAETMNQLMRTTPEEMGLHSQNILNLLERLEKENISVVSMMLLRHNQVLYKAYWPPYTQEQLRTVYSLSKTFTAMAIGIAAGEGKIRLDERIVDLFPEQAKNAPDSPQLQMLTIRHLLMMSTGQGNEPFHQENAWDDAISAFLREPFADAPGETFRYNTGATYMLSAALKQRGIDLEEYLRDKLLTPMGITGTRWIRDPNGICTGGFGFSLHPEDIAKLGILLMQSGRWNGQQLVPEWYVREATRRQIGNGDDPNSDWAQGYGYQIWQCRHGAFRADGMYGQFCVVHPATDTILVTNCLTQNMGGVLNAYFDEVLMKYESDAVVDEPEVTERLRQKTANLRYERDLPEDDGSPIPPEYLNLDAPNVWMRLTLDGDMLTMRNTQGQLLVTAGRGKWHTIHRAVHCEPFFTRDKTDTPALGAWGMKDGRLTLKIFEPEMVEEDTLTVEKTEQGVHVQMRITTTGDENVFFDQTIS